MSSTPKTAAYSVQNGEREVSGNLTIPTYASTAYDNKWVHASLQYPWLYLLSRTIRNNQTTEQLEEASSSKHSLKLSGQFCIYRLMISAKPENVQGFFSPILHMQISAPFCFDRGRHLERSFAAPKLLAGHSVCLWRYGPVSRWRWIIFFIFVDV